MGKPRQKSNNINNNNNNNNNNNKNSNQKSKLGVYSKAVHKSTASNNNEKKKSKASSLKNQIRSTQRFLLRDLPAEVREAQEKKLEELKKEQLDQNRLAEERKNFIRDKKIKFFERRKIERRIRRTEKQQRVSLNEEEEKKVVEELHKLKNDLEYVRFFPKTEKYVPLFCGNDNPEIVDNINRLRTQIKANIIAAAASGKDLEETGSEDDGPIDLTDDDFFVSGSSSDEADADDELTDLSAREQASTAPTSAALELSIDQTNQRQKSAQSLMPPPRPQKSSSQRFHTQPRNFSKNPKTSHSSDGGFRHSQAGQSSNRKFKFDIPEQSNNSGFRHGQASQNSKSSNRLSISDIPEKPNVRGFRHGQVGQSSHRFSNPDNKQSNEFGFRHAQAGPSGNRNSNSDTGRHTNDPGFQNSQVSQSSNISSNSDAPTKKPRKRRPKKRKQ